MSIGAVSATTVYPSTAQATTGTAASTPSSLGYGPGTEYSYLTSQDVAVLEKATGTTSFAQLNTVDPELVSDINISEKYGDISSSGQSLAESLPTYYLTPADASLFEAATGTTNLVDAARSSPGAEQIIVDVGSQREDGLLTGPLTAGVLQGYLASYEQSANQGPAFERADIAADIAFLKQTIQFDTPGPSGTVDTVA